MLGQSDYRGGSGRGSRSFRDGYQGRSNHYDPSHHRGRESEKCSGRPFPRHSSGPIMHNFIPFQSQSSRGWCEICKVYCGGSHNMELHKNGKKHKWKLAQLQKPQIYNVINKRQNRQMPNSQLSVAVHTEVVQESEKTGCPSENMSSDATPYIRMVNEERPRDKISACDHSLKLKTMGDGGGKYMRTKDGQRRRLSKLPEPTQVTSLICELHNDTLKSQVVFEHHLNGKQHLSNLEHFPSKEERLALDGSNLSTATRSPDGSSKHETVEIMTCQLAKTHYAQMSVCLNCGDRGWPETLVYCNGCEVYAVHRYCLDTACVIYDDDVTWFCEDCDMKVVEPSSLLPYGTGVSVDLAAVDAVHVRTEPENPEKVQDICVRAVSSSDGGTSLHCEQTECHMNCENDSKSEGECGPVLQDVANSKEKSGSVQISQVRMDEDLNILQLERQAEAQPIADPVWRGGLYIYSSSIIMVSGLVAHMSSLACSKVLEEARLFPEVLSMDMLQRSVVWPKGFQKWGPTDQSIALYFFPENERDEKAFDKLVDDLIGSEMALRAVVENAELLIFPSTVLPAQYRRFQAKYYLWGVFKAKPNLQVINDMVSREDTDVAKPVTCDRRSPLSTLSNSGSYDSNAPLSCASVF